MSHPRALISWKVKNKSLHRFNDKETSTSCINKQNYGQIFHHVNRRSTLNYSNKRYIPIALVCHCPRLLAAPLPSCPSSPCPCPTSSDAPPASSLFTSAACRRTSTLLANHRRKGSAWKIPSAENQVVKGASRSFSCMISLDADL